MSEGRSSRISMVAAVVLDTAGELRAVDDRDIQVVFKCTGIGALVLMWISVELLKSDRGVVDFLPPHETPILPFQLHFKSLEG